MFSLVSGECMGDGEYIQIFWEPGMFSWTLSGQNKGKFVDGGAAHFLIRNCRLI